MKKIYNLKNINFTSSKIFIIQKYQILKIPNKFRKINQNQNISKLSPPHACLYPPAGQ